MTIGPLMLDLEGTSLSSEDKSLLRQPLVGGVILFARNFVDVAQLSLLCQEIHQLREPHLLIAVDQEGGRVQRFRQDFSRLPAAARFGQLHAVNPQRARRLCHQAGWLMATELGAAGVDFSLAPVLDLDIQHSAVTAERAFSDSAQTVAELALAWMAGVHEAGMAVVGKHFPGHGGVTQDSHRQLPRDTRPLADIRRRDMTPFRRMIKAGMEALMPAHVVYTAADTRPAGYSRFWLQRMLRGELGFQGVIFSDDLSMQAADLGASYAQRAAAALAAGCDMVLACNNRAGALEIIETLQPDQAPASQLRLLRLHGRGRVGWRQLRLDPRWRQAVQALEELTDGDSLSLALGPRSD